MFIEFVQQNIIWVLVALISGTMLIWPLFVRDKSALTPAQATTMINREDAVVLDVRETGELGTGHIVGARHITLAQLGSRLSEIEKFKARPIIVCCARGQRSAGACTQLKKAGFERAYSLAGGLDAWLGASLPVTTKG